jgi:hypothetical protein
VPPPERRWPGLVAGYAVLLGLLAAAATPAYLYVEPSDRPTVVRVAVAAVVGVALLHLVRVARARVAAQPPSAFEQALVPSRAEVRLPPVFERLRDEIRHSVASQGYFERVLWPRLVGLAARRAGGPASGELRAPKGRRLLGRGPSLDTLRKLITESGTRS